MARKIKFALEMADGAKVRGSLEELREHFDLESAVRYFLSGKLVEWLDDRYYEKEAEALEAIDKDAPDLNKRLCEALGVEYDAGEDLDVAALERLNEKKVRPKSADRRRRNYQKRGQNSFNAGGFSGFTRYGRRRNLSLRRRIYRARESEEQEIYRHIGNAESGD